MNKFEKQEAEETLHLVRDRSYNMEREPHIVICELYNELRHLTDENQRPIDTEDELT